VREGARLSARAGDSQLTQEAINKALETSPARDVNY